MVDTESRERRLLDRRRRILEAARARADSDGWEAVTTRHLASTIGYTQPVLYGHFPGGKTEIMRAVALEGFTELAERCRSAVGRKRGRNAVKAVAGAYLDFAGEHPALYEAMFQLPIDARFAADDSEVELKAGFDALAEVIDGDGSATEVLWAALHGISQLERAGRMRPEHRAARVADLADRFVS